MAILVTGGSGFLGTALTPRLIGKGHRVYSLSRHPPAPAENLIPLTGDILKPDLGLDEVPGDIHAVHHLAAIHRLGEDKDGSIWQTNVVGTRNVIDFCIQRDIPRLFFCSTAYSGGRNTYEASKRRCEHMVTGSKIPRATIFKPSIVVGTEAHFYHGHFSQFVLLLIKVHRRADTIRRKVEGLLRLPLLEPVHRIRGNPNGNLNLVPLDQVVNAMVEIDDEGTFWLTNPRPPRIQQLADWVSEIVMLIIKIEPEPFKPSLVEMAFDKRTKAFTPYLEGDDFPSDLKHCPRITKTFIHDTIKRALTSAAGKV